METVSNLITKQVSLVCGIEINGNLVKEVTITEMSGRVLTEIANAQIRSDITKSLETIILRCVKDIGGVPMTAKIFNEMTSADADTLLLEIRKLTKGSMITGNITCESCKAENDIEFDLNDIENVMPSEEYRHENGSMVFDLVSEDGKVHATCRLPKIKDRKPLLKMMRQNPYKALQLMIVNCLIKWNEETDFYAEFLDNQPLRYSDWIIEEFQNKMVGPNLSITAPCVECGVANDLRLEASNFLFPIRKKKQSS